MWHVIKFFKVSNKDKCILFEKPDINSKQIAILKKAVIMKLIKINKEWCQVTVMINEKPKYTGYIQRTDVYGILPNEVYPK